MKMLKHIAPLASLALVAACSNGGDVDEQAEMTPDQPASSAPADTATEPTETTAPTATSGSDAAATIMWRSPPYATAGNAPRSRFL